MIASRTTENVHTTFGRHERQRSLQSGVPSSGWRRVVPLEHFGAPKVAELRHAVGAYHNVRTLDVSVRDAALVEVPQALQDLAREASNGALLQRAELLH